MLVSTLRDAIGKIFSLIRISEIIEFCILFKLNEEVEVDYWKVDFVFPLSHNLTEAEVENKVVPNLHFEDFCVLELALTFVDECFFN